MAAYRQVPVYLIFIVFNLIYGSKISDQRLCADKKCEETISHVSTLMKFDKRDPQFLSFKGNEIVQVKSKSAGSRPDLWGGETSDGRRGYFPKAFVREFKVDIANPEFVVPTEDASIESKLGLKTPNPPSINDDDKEKKDDSSAEQNKEGEGEGHAVQDETEIDDTEISDETADSTQKDSNEQQAEDSKQTADDTEIDDTEIGEDDEADKHTDDHKHETGDDDTEFDKEDLEETAPQTQETVDDEDFMVGMEDLDKNLFDIHENLDDFQDVDAELKESTENHKEDTAQEHTKPIDAQTTDERVETSDQSPGERETDRLDAFAASKKLTVSETEDAKEKTLDVPHGQAHDPQGQLRQEDPNVVVMQQKQEEIKHVSESTVEIEGEEKHVTEQSGDHGQGNVEADPRDPAGNVPMQDPAQQGDQKPDLHQQASQQHTGQQSTGGSRVPSQPHYQEQFVPPKKEPLDVKPEAGRDLPQGTQTGQGGAGTGPEAVKTEDTGSQTGQEASPQQSVHETPHDGDHKPVDIGFTPDELPTSQDTVLSSSMGEQLTETVKATPLPELNLRETVIDGTTIPLFDDDYGPSSIPYLETSTSAVNVNPSETQYMPNLTDLPFADEPPGFKPTQDKPASQDATAEQSQVSEQRPPAEVKLEENQYQDTSEQFGRDQVSQEPLKKAIDNQEPKAEMPQEQVFNTESLVNDSRESDHAAEISPTTDDVYHSDDFVSRKPLSVGQINSGQDIPGSVDPSQASETTQASDTADTTTTPPFIEELPIPPIETTTEATEQAAESREEIVDRGSPTDEPLDSLNEQTRLDEQQTETPPAEDPYKTEAHMGRHFSEEELDQQSEEMKRQESPGFMQSLEKSTKNIINKLPPSIQTLLEQEPLGLSPTLWVLVTVATLISLVTVTLCSCLCGGGQKVHKKDPVVVVREIEEKLFIATKEKENLEDELLQIRTQKKQLEKQLTSQESSSGSAKLDLQNVKLHNEALKKTVSQLEQEVKGVNSQLSSVNSNTQSKDKQTKDLQKHVSKLEEKLKKNSELLESKSRELKDSAEDMATLKGQIKSFSEQVKQLETSKQQLLSEADDWKEKVEELNEQLHQNGEEVKQMQETLAFKDNEMEVLKDCFRQLKTMEGEEDSEGSVDSAGAEEKIQKMMDVSRVNARLRSLEDDHDSLENRLQIETDGRKEVEDQLEKCRRDLETVQTDKMKADRQCQEAQTKLNVLSNYFKEKEAQLQRELGEHEALKKQNVNKMVNIDEHARMMEQEVEMYKAQIESFKRELESSERDFRSQIAANEKKAHENWLAARSAERELKEVRHDASVLRQKLTELERRNMMGPGGLIRPLPTRGMPPPAMMNGPPPPGMERSPLPPPPHLRDDDFRVSPHHDRLPPPPDRRPPSPGGRLPPHMPPDGRSPPPGDRIPPLGGRMPPPEARSPPPFDRRPPPLDRRTPPYRPLPPDMMHHPRGPPPPFGARSPPPRMPPPPGMEMGDPRTSSPKVRPRGPPDSRQPPRQHSQV